MLYVALGDSITAPRAGVVGYCQLLAEHLAPLSLTKLVNSGVGSLDSTGLLARFNELCLAWQPQVVTLMIGANDHVIDPNQTQPRVPLAQYEANLRSTLALIGKLEHGHSFNQGHPLLVLMTPPFITSQKVGGADLNEARLLDYCYLIKQLCLEYQLTCIDVHEITASAAQWDEQLWATLFTQNGDGVHPNTQTHALIFPYVEAALGKAIVSAHK